FRKNDIIGSIHIQHIQDKLFEFFRVAINMTDTMKGQSEFFSKRPKGFIVSNHRLNIGMQLTEISTYEQIAQAMMLLCNHDNNILPLLWNDQYFCIAGQYFRKRFVHFIRVNCAGYLKSR